MNFIVKLVRPSLSTPLRAAFSSDVWREWEQGAEKVYISEEEKRTLNNLLGKIEESEHSPGVKDLQFEQSLKQILKKYSVSDAAFEAEVVNLHRQG